MIVRYFKKQIQSNRFFILLLLLFSQSAFSGDIKTVSGISGTSIIANAIVAIEDPNEACISAGNACATPIHVEKSKLYAKLWFENSQLINHTNWTLDVTYEIELTTESGVSSPLPLAVHTLSIDYDQINSFVDIDIEDFNSAGNQLNYVKAKLTVLSVNYSGAVIPSDVKLDLVLESEQYKSYIGQNQGIDDNAIVEFNSTTGYDASKNELEVYWNYVEKAESYDLEWLFIDVGSDLSLSGTYDYDFKDATRINTSANHYKISVAYPKGYLLFRARPRTKYSSTYNNNWVYGTGSWSSSSQGQITPSQVYQQERNSINLNYPVFICPGLETNKNWQYSATYAEEGKRKEVISYYDGALYNRQSVTLTNSNNTAIVGQTIYDFTGRPAVNVMPAALTSSGISYYDDLSKNNAGADYGYKDFDVNATGLLPNVAAMDKNTSAGAAKYYSDQNTVTSENSDYVPDSKGYPFSRTIYANDGTDRVLRVSGVGEELNLNNDHTTRYLYGVPGGQVELDRLFANEVGDVENYKKNAVIDPNGQTSVTYLDGKGRTIATALSGTSSQLEELDTKPSQIPTITADLTDFNKVVDGNKVIATKSILVTSPSVYKFDYSLPASLFVDCIKQGGVAPFDADCKYNLSLHLTNEETGEMVPLSITSGGSTTMIDNVITGTFTSSGILSFFTQNQLQVGTYQLIKSLEVDEANLDIIINDFISYHTNTPNTCYDFIAPPSVTSCDNCIQDCEDYYTEIDLITRNKTFYDATGKKLGVETYNVSTSSYNAIVLELGVTQGEISAVNALILSCQSECSTQEEVSPCEDRYEELKADMSPGGQYFDNTPGILAGGINGWLSGNGTISQIPVSYSNWDDVRANWDVSWGDIMVEQHPEYCAFTKYCCVNGNVVTDLNGESCYNDYESLDLSVKALDGYDKFAGTDCNLDVVVNNPNSCTSDLSAFHGVNGIIGNGPNQIKAADFYEFHYNRFLEEAKYQLALDECNSGSDVFPLAGISTNANITSNGFIIHYPAIDWTGADLQNNQVANCNDACEDQADQWLTEFKCLEAITDTNHINELKQALIDICQSSCSQTSVPNDTIADAIQITFKGTPYPVKTFEDVLSLIRNQYSLQDVHCPTPKFPESVAEENCYCDNVLNFAVDHSGLDYLALPLNYTGFSVDLEALLLQFTGDSKSSWFKDVYNDCRNGTNVVNTNQLPSLLDCETAPTITIPDYETTCVTQTNALNLYNAKQAYNAFLNQKAEELRIAYREQCVDNVLNNETFTVNYNLDEYHYTLYFYDQADNLVKTVPPEGVYQEDGNKTVLFDVTDINTTNQSSIDAYRLGTGAFQHAPYAMFTNYKYNSLQQLVEQTTPDGGKQIFFYDKLGRLIASQNAEQKSRGDFYSYTVYDELSRISLVVEIQGASPLTNEIARELNGNLLLDWTSLNLSITDIVQTTYDIPATVLPNGFIQKNLRNRISYITYDKDGSGTDHTTYYTYDINGNVETLLLKNTELSSLVQEYKKVDYEYDLVSGNVNKVAYQKGEADEFYHKYIYDADNRLVKASTSRNDIIWEDEAKYFYYAHGPLARTEIGDKKVQAQDNAYTLQGWLKAINSSTGEHTRDIGKDGIANTLNQHTARDVYGLSLHYYNGDYSAASTNANTDMLASVNHSGFNTNSKPLYNGNISKIVKGLTDHNEQKVNVIGNAYKYDVLNRIKSYNALLNTGTDVIRETNSFNGEVSISAYQSIYSYDGNGNINTLTRNGKYGLEEMDDFSYIYQASGIKTDNKLNYVDDSKPAGNYSTDLDAQASSNYAYDELGRLTKDLAEGIAAIKWNVSNKIIEIIRDPSSTKASLTFKYDAFGNRITKQVTPKTGSPYAYHYVRDAQGNVLATYKETGIGTAIASIELVDYSIYGSSRLGTKTENLSLTSPNAITITNATGISLTGNTITKTAGNSWWNGGGTSGQTIKGDGYVKWTLSNSNIDNTNVFVGVSTVDGGPNFPSIQYAWHTSSNSSGSRIYESGSYISNTGGYSAGEILEIRRTGTTLEYFKSGVLRRTVNNVTTDDLYVDFSLYQQNVSKITGIEMGDAYKTLTLVGEDLDISKRILGTKQYEQTDHLGNVLQTISDRKLAQGGALVTEEDFTSGTGSFIQIGSTISNQNGVLEIQSTSQYNGVERSFPTVVGTKYILSYEASMGNAPALGSVVYDASGNVLNGSSLYITSSGTQSVCFEATSSTSIFKFYTNDAVNANEFYLDNFKVTENVYYVADVKSYSDYYPFGMKMPGRYGSESNGKYRWGWNGAESDDEMYAQEGNSYDLGARHYDSRIGRMKSIDPLSASYPWQSPYVYHRNSPIAYIDFLGMGDPPDKPTNHTVESGDNLSDIAKEHKVSVKDLVKWNKIKDVNATIHPGDNFIVSDPTEYNEWANSPSSRDDHILSMGGDLTATDNHVTLSPKGSKNHGKVTKSEGTIESVKIAQNKIAAGIGKDIANDLYTIYTLGLFVNPGTIGMGNGGRGAKPYYPVTGSSSAAVGEIQAVEVFYTNAHGQLTNGNYTVITESMQKHVTGGIMGKSMFYPTINAEASVLKAASYADEMGLWVGNKAKVNVLNSNIGTLGTGQPTNIINVYRKSTGAIHGTPGGAL